MFKRKIYDQLLSWKRESQGRSALLVEGARRVGKSTIAAQFAENEYDSHILVDFTTASEEFKRTFLETRGDLDSFFLYLSAAYSAVLVERRSLIVFDEIQAFPRAREFVKHLVADGRYDYLETGSLVSIRENVKDILLPSEEEAVSMRPMDFEEFCWAMGEEALSRLIRASFSSRMPLPDDMHRKAMRLMREYMLVGGMPQAVAAYVTGRDMAAADGAKRSVLRLYRNDIEKYGGTSAKRVKAVFDNVPGLLSRHEKKLVYSRLEPGGRSRDFSTAFHWLSEAGTVNICTASTDPSIGFALSADDSTVKCYLADTGLLSAMAFSPAGDALPEAYRQVLLGKADVNEGMLVENFVAQQLVAAGHELYFYSKWSRDASERMEIDFLLVHPFADAAGKPRVTPVEVKSGRRYRTVSLEKFKAKFGARVGALVVVHPRQLEIADGIVKLPLYMSFCL